MKKEKIKITSKDTAKIIVDGLLLSTAFDLLAKKYVNNFIIREEIGDMKSTYLEEDLKSSILDEAKQKLINMLDSIKDKDIKEDK